jgi:hypothetical protein
VILHTTVTISYDAPWRQVHDRLIAAAADTEAVPVDPPPFVLQTGLDDFYVRYELNVHTDLPNEMGRTYSELHQNIQDRFNPGRRRDHVAALPLAARRTRQHDPPLPGGTARRRGRSAYSRARNPRSTRRIVESPCLRPLRGDDYRVGCGSSPIRAHRNVTHPGVARGQ